MTSYAGLEETARHDPLDQPTSEAASTSGRSLVLKEGRRRLGLVGTRPWPWLVVVKDLALRRTSDVREDAVPEVALKKLSHASTTRLGARHPAAASLAYDTKGLRATVRLRQETASTLATIQRRHAVVATSAAPEAVRLVPSDTRVVPAAGRPEATPNPFHAFLRPDPSAVDASSGLVVGDDGAGNAYAQVPLP